MKICVCGKGGSGKSTVVALLAAELRRRGKQVLVVDSDESNAGLYWMLGFKEPPVPLMELAGGKKNIQRALRTAFTEDGAYEEKPVLARDELGVDDLQSVHVQRASGIGLVCIGKIHQALEGCACPMGVLSREFLKKLRTGNDEVVVVDMEAGVEHFGRGVETSVDAVLVVTEPSLESVGLAERIKELTLGAGAQFAGAVLNKVNRSQRVSLKPLTAGISSCCRQFPFGRSFWRPGWKAGRWMPHRLQEKSRRCWILFWRLPHPLKAIDAKGDDHVPGTSRVRWL